MMNRFFRFSPALLACVFAIPLAAQDRLLPPTYVAGKEYVFLIDQAVEMDVSAVAATFGQEADKVSVNAKLVLAATCKNGPEAGQRTVDYRTRRLQVSIKGNGVDIDYDTNEPGAEDTILGQQFGPLEYMNFGMILDENEQVVKATDMDVFRNSGGRFFNPEQLMEAVNLTIRLGIPPAGVAVDDEWKSSSTMNLGTQVGDLKLNFDVNYAGDEEIDGFDCGVLKFDADINLNLQSSGGDPEAPRLSVRVEEKTAKGEMKIDKELRFFREGSLDLDLVMTFDLAGSLTIPISLKQNLVLSEVRDL